MPIFWGLSAALGWGLADFWATRISRASGSIRGLMWTQAAGIIPLLFILFGTGQASPAGLHLWATVIPIALLHFLSATLLYRAFEIGSLSVVSPIASGYIVVTAILAYLSGERASALTLGGAALLFAGVIALTAFPLKNTGSTKRGIIQALASALGYGLLFWRLPGFTPILGTVWPLIILRGTTACCSFLYFQTRPEKGLAPPGNLLPYIAAVAVADAWAWWSFSTGTHTGDNTTLVTALASLFGGVTALLAWSFLKERLSRMQWLGLAVVMVGIVLVSL